MTRTDIHRPSAPEFDPQAYDLLGVFDLAPEWGDRRERGETVRAALAQGYSFAGAPHPHGQCDHCGAHIRYEALLVHLPTRTLIEAGEDCLSYRFGHTAASFKALRAEAARRSAETRERNARHEIAVEALAWLAEQDDPRLVELSYRGNGGSVDASDFLTDVAAKLMRYGSLSERQMFAVGTAITRDADRTAAAARREAAEAARVATAAPAPLGKVTVRGTVEHTWTKETDYGTAHKFRVRSPQGWIVISTIPAGLIREFEAELADERVNVWAVTDRLRGREVEFTATLALGRNEPEPTVAFASRPTKARLLPATPDALA